MSARAGAALVLSLLATAALAWVLPAGTLALASGELALELLLPRALCLLALAPLLVWLSRRSLAALPPMRRRTATALRCALLAALALALARPTSAERARESAAVIVVDVSDSMDDSALARARAYIERARRVRGERSLAIVTFASGAERHALPEAGRPVALQRHDDGTRSDLERALALSLSLLDPNAYGRIALFSDLAETHGSVQRGLTRVRERAAELAIAPALDKPRPEVGVVELGAPREVRAGESFALRARLFANGPSRVRVRLTRDGVEEAAAGWRELSLAAGETTAAFRSRARGAGSAEYAVELAPLTPDTFAANNRYTRIVSARSAPRVLYVEHTRAEAEPLAELLRASGFAVDVRIGGDAPTRAEALAGYDFYLLSDVEAAALPSGAMPALVSYVRAGGGFMMVGGERAFGPGGYEGTPIEPILPVALSGALRSEEPSLALMLVIDKSGSMAGEKLERAKEAALATADLLGARNYLGVIGFDAEPLRVVRLMVASQRASIARSISTLAAGGGTALFPALDAAYGDLAGVRARVKHVVVLTDGQSQEESLDELVRSMRADGITVSAIGLGDDVNRGLLDALARGGGGRAYFTRDPARVPRLFTQETEIVASSPLRERALRAKRVGDADFLRGIAVDDAPPLRGIVATRALPAPAQLLLSSERDEPLLARVRVGLGWSLAFTSDLKARWSSEWFRWKALSPLIAQLVREHMRRDQREALPIEARIEGDRLHAAIDVVDDAGRFVNGLTGTLRVRGRDGERRVPLVQQAPGRYAATLPLSALGAYALEAELGPEGAAPSLLARGHASHPFPLEYARRDEQSRALRALLQAAGAVTLPPPEQLFAPHPGAARSRRERWAPLLWLSLALFLLDVAVRRAPLRRGSAST